MNAQLEHETRIVWERDGALEMDYVRVSGRQAGTRQRGVQEPPAGERVGYAVLAEDAPNTGRPGYFRRRVFWLKEHDRANEPDGIYSAGAPHEAIDPRTVEPGKEGELTERAWGAPLAGGDSE